VSGHGNSEVKTIRRQVDPWGDKPGMRSASVKRTGFGSKAGTLLFGVALVATAVAAPSTKQVEQQAQAVAALQTSAVSWHKGGWNDVMTKRWGRTVR